MAINYVFDAPHLNAGRGAMLRDFNFSSLDGVGKAFPGMAFAFQGRVFQVIQNRSGGALAQGDGVSLLLGDAARTGNLTGASTSAIAVTDDTLDLGLKGARDYPGYIGITAGVFATTADQEVREIRGNSAAAGASTVTVAEVDRSIGPNYMAATSSPDGFSTTPDATYDYEVQSPWEVIKVDLDALTTSIYQGTVVSTSITDDFFGIIQTHGLAVAKVDGTTDLVSGDLLHPDSGAGILSKWVVGAPDANGVTRSNFICARILNAYTNNGVGQRFVQLFGDKAIIPYPITM